MRQPTILELSPDFVLSPRLPLKWLLQDSNVSRNMGRRRVHISEETEKKASSVLLSLLPKDGRRIGNLKLLDEFLQESKARLSENFDEDVYWNIRNVLIEEGKLERGRGKGGSVRLVDGSTQQKKARARGYQKESALYDRFHQTIQKEWVQEYDITDYVSEVSANRGRRDAGGKWTVPDVTLVSVDNYPFVPGKSVEVITFEIKPADAYGVEGVYETASHSAFATKSYLALHVPSGQPEKD